MGAIGPQALDRLGIGIEGDPDSAEMGREVRLGQIATDGATQEGDQLGQRHWLVGERGQLAALCGSATHRPERQQLTEKQHREQQSADQEAAWLPVDHWGHEWAPSSIPGRARAVAPFTVGEFVLLPEREVSLFPIIAVFSTACPAKFGPQLESQLDDAS